MLLYIVKGFLDQSIEVDLNVVVQQEVIQAGGDKIYLEVVGLSKILAIGKQGAHQSKLIQAGRTQIISQIADFRDGTL